MARRCVTAAAKGLTRETGKTLALASQLFKNADDLAYRMGGDS